MARASRTRGNQALLVSRIHSTLLNQIAALVAQSQVCESAVDSGDARSVAEVLRLQDMLKTLEKAARQIIDATLEESGSTLADSLLTELDKLQQTHPEIRVASSLDGAVNIRARWLMRLIVDVVHEALANAARHGRPSELELVASRAAGGMLVRLRDNGRGFDVQSVMQAGSSARAHYGIHIMQESAKSANGRLEISSAPGRGTQVTLFVPLPVPRAER